MRDNEILCILGIGTTKQQMALRFIRPWAPTMSPSCAMMGHTSWRWVPPSCFSSSSSLSLNIYYISKWPRPQWCCSGSSTRSLVPRGLRHPRCDRFSHQTPAQSYHPIQIRITHTNEHTHTHTHNTAQHTTQHNTRTHIHMPWQATADGKVFSWGIENNNVSIGRVPPHLSIRRAVRWLCFIYYIYIYVYLDICMCIL